MADDEPTGIDGDCPDAEAGPESCEATADEVETAPEPGQEVHEAEYPPAAEIDEAFPVESLRTVLAQDGLPDHSAEDPTAGEAPPLTYDTMACVADDRQYVEMFEEEIMARYPQAVGQRESDRSLHLVKKYRLPDRDWSGMSVWHRSDVVSIFMRSAYGRAGHALDRLVYDPRDVIERFGLSLVRLNDGFVLVRPKREACIHYKRQRFPVTGDPSRKIVFRNCIHPARRSIGGAALSLRDENVLGCDYREPYDRAVNAEMDARDGATLREEPHRTRLPLFGTVGDVVRAERRPS